MVVIRIDQGEDLQRLSEQTGLFYTAKRFHFDNKEYLEVNSTSKIFLAFVRKELMGNDEKELFDHL